MQEYIFFLKGLVMGLTIAAVGGPVSILCIRKTIKEGWQSGVALGCGAALADALFGAIVGFGLTIVSNFLLHYQKIISIVGSLFLVYLGIAMFFETTEQDMCDTTKKSILKTVATSFFITLSNPATILFFTAISVSIKLDLTNYLAALSMVSGIFLGSILWFSGLTGVLTYFQKAVTPQRMRTLNKILGIGLVFFGFFIIIKIFLIS